MLLGANNLERKDILKSLLKEKNPGSVWLLLSLYVYEKECSPCVLRLARHYWGKEMSQAAATLIQTSRGKDQTLVSFMKLGVCLCFFAFKGTSWQRVTNSVSQRGPGRQHLLLVLGRLQLALSMAWECSGSGVATAMMALSQRDPVVTAPFSCPRCDDY